MGKTSSISNPISHTRHDSPTLTFSCTQTDSRRIIYPLLVVLVHGSFYPCTSAVAGVTAAGGSAAAIVYVPPISTLTVFGNRGFWRAAGLTWAVMDSADWLQVTLPAPLNNSSRGSGIKTTARRFFPPTSDNSHTYVRLVHAPAGFIHPIPLHLSLALISLQRSLSLSTPLAPLTSRAPFIISLCAWSHSASALDSNPIGDKSKHLTLQRHHHSRFLYHQRTPYILQVRNFFFQSSIISRDCDSDIAFLKALVSSRVQVTIPIRSHICTCWMALFIPLSDVIN